MGDAVLHQGPCPIGVLVDEDVLKQREPQRAWVLACRDGSLVHERQRPSELGRIVPEIGDVAVRKLTGPAYGGVDVAAEKDRRPRLRGGRRRHTDGVISQDRPREGETSPRPGATKNLDGVEKAWQPLAERDPEHPELFFPPTEPEPDRESSRRQLIYDGRVFGEANRIMKRRQHDAGSESDHRRGGRKGPEHDEQRWHVPVGRPVVLTYPRRVEPRRLRHTDQLECIRVFARERPSRARRELRGEEPDSHGQWHADERYDAERSPTGLPGSGPDDILIRMRAILSIIMTASVLSACGTATGQRQGDTPLVIAGVYPLAEAVQRVAGDDVEVMNLTPAGVEPHDLELTADDIVSIAEADLVVYVGGGFQPALENALGETSAGAVDVLDAVETLPASNHDDDGSFDPHVWLDPARYEQVVNRVAEALGSIVPPSSPMFDRNAAAFGAELEDLNASYRDGLAHCRSRVIVVNHAAFGYLASAYDLEQEPITGISPEAEPDPRRFAELGDLVRNEGITTVFTEELAPPDAAEALADETGIETAVLNPLEGLTDAELVVGDDYVAVMERNLEVLRRGLGCR